MKSLEIIANSLENKSAEWHFNDDSHYLIHKKSDIALWASSGELGLEVQNSKLEMDDLQRRGLWVSVQRCLESMLQEKCKRL